MEPETREFAIGIDDLMTTCLCRADTILTKFSGADAMPRMPSEVARMALVLFDTEMQAARDSRNDRRTEAIMAAVVKGLAQMTGKKVEPTDDTGPRINLDEEAKESDGETEG